MLLRVNLHSINYNAVIIDIAVAVYLLGGQNIYYLRYTKLFEKSAGFTEVVPRRSVIFFHLLSVFVLVT